MANQVFLQLPVPALDVIGWENTASVSGSVTLTLPSFAFVVGDVDSIALSLPAPVLAIAGTTGLAAEVALDWPRPQLAIAGTPGVTGAVTLTLPGFVLEAHDPGRVTLVLPAPALAVAGATGAVGSVVLRAPAPGLAAVGAVPFVGTSAFSLLPALAVTGVTGAAGTLGLTLRALALAAEGYTGAIGTVALTLPVLTLEAAGYGAHVGTVTLTLPNLLLEAAGGPAAGTTFTTVALQTQNQALTTYTNYPFNSFARFNGLYLAAGTGGIFSITGATDNGTAIDAVARLAATDFGTSALKRIDRLYVGYRADGDLQLKVILEGDDEHTYLLPHNAQESIHGHHAKLGRGLAARYWQFEVANRSGADFSLDLLEARPATLKRRVG